MSEIVEVELRLKPANMPLDVVQAVFNAGFDAGSGDDTSDNAWERFKAEHFPGDTAPVVNTLDDVTREIDEITKWFKTSAVQLDAEYKRKVCDFLELVQAMPERLHTAAAAIVMHRVHKMTEELSKVIG